MTKPLTPDERKALLRRRIWDVDDFAAFASLSHWQAKERLKVYDGEMSGMLLRKSNGTTNRKYTFHSARLAKAFPDLFEDIENLAIEVREQGDMLEAEHQASRLLAFQTGENTRAIGRIERLIAKLRRAA
jgi:hypothetical protein